MSLNKFSRYAKVAQIMGQEEKERVSPYMQEFINYRKSGLSLNHIIGCPLDCAYCVRHFWGNFDMKKPQLLCSDDEAVDQLVNHKYFRPHKTPLQLFNKATEPFLPSVSPHTHYVLNKLDAMGLRNVISVVTRAKLDREDIKLLNSLKNLKLTLYFTYSGIKNEKIEPISRTQITVNSIKLSARYKTNFKTILYWRPIVPGWNDDQETMSRVLNVGKLVDAIVFTGFYHKKENDEHLTQLGVKAPYSQYERRKVLPLELERRVIKAHKESGIKVPLFRKTSCGAAYVHKIPDFNGHWGIQELCDICPKDQQMICKKDFKSPDETHVSAVLESLKCDPTFFMDEGYLWTTSLGEDRRYFMQHYFNYQIWESTLPHFKYLHGRAPIGYELTDEEKENYIEIKEKFKHVALHESD